MKRCIQCGLDKPLSEFYVKRVKQIGIQTYPRCKPCYNSWTYRRQGKAYVKRDPCLEKERARDVLKKAVRHGRIVKPACCEECGKPTPKRSLEGHHSDYTKPFQVRWLCRPCHGKQPD